jgi:hypothetical protein
MKRHGFLKKQQLELQSKSHNPARRHKLTLKIAEISQQLLNVLIAWYLQSIDMIFVANINFGSSRLRGLKIYCLAKITMAR